MLSYCMDVFYAFSRVDRSLETETFVKILLHLLNSFRISVLLVLYRKYIYFKCRVIRKFRHEILKKI